MTKPYNPPSIITIMSSCADALAKEKSNDTIPHSFEVVNHSLLLTTETDAEKLFTQGKRYEDGDDEIQKNEDLAFQYFLAAARLSHPAAQYAVYYLSHYLSKSENEIVEALEWLKKSAELGYGPAQACLVFDAECELPEHERDKFIEKSSLWYEKRANDGDAESQYDYAMIHWQGRAWNSDRGVGTKWMEAAASQDHVHACRSLGEELLASDFSEQGTEQAINWLSRAAELGNWVACRSLADFYLNGGEKKAPQYSPRPQRIKPDKDKVVYWYERAMKLGCSLSAGILGRLYLSGEILDKDLTLAEKWLLVAFEKNDRQAAYLLASEYTSGMRLERNLEKAEAILIKLAETGYGPAMHQLYLEHATGGQFTLDSSLALQWLLLAAYNHEIKSILKLGDMYSEGTSVPQNFNEALQFYFQAAKRNYGDAHQRLGDIYLSGKGVPCDLVEAYKWFDLASNSRNWVQKTKDKSAEYRDAIAQKMTQAQIAKAQKLVQEWEPDFMQKWG